MALLTVHDLRSDQVVLHGERGEWLLRPISDKPLLRHIAGFEVHDDWSTHWKTTAASHMRYWFDSWPQPWMGITVAEELAFGQVASQSTMDETLSRWQLDALPMQTSLLTLTHFDAIRLMLARAELSACELLLMEQPDAGLSDAELQTLGGLLQSWLQRSDAMAIITTNREWWGGKRVNNDC